MALRIVELITVHQLAAGVGPTPPEPPARDREQETPSIEAVVLGIIVRAQNRKEGANHG